MATPLTDSINALTTYANSVTGATDTTLSDAVYTLAQGFGGGLDRLLTHVEFTPTEKITIDNRVSIQLEASSSCFIFVIIDTIPESPDASDHIAIVSMHLASAYGYAQYGYILRPNGTIGTDAWIYGYEQSTGELQIGGRYGYIFANTTYHIYQFAV